MTPAQMLAKLNSTAKPCSTSAALKTERLQDVLDSIATSSVKMEPCGDCGLYMGHTRWCPQGRVEVAAKTVYGPVLADFATTKSWTHSECLGRRLCPICGGSTTFELDLTDQSKEYHWCVKNAMHAFEFDKENNLVDRVPL